MAWRPGSSPPRSPRSSSTCTSAARDATGCSSGSRSASSSLQSIIGLASNSTTVYLAQPVLIAAAWGLAFLVSIPLGRPLAGALAYAWYPFPERFRESPEFKRVFAVESVVWGAYFLGRSALRLASS